MEEIYVVKVRTEPDPARLYPSERRYSALTVGGLGAVHLLLAATSLLLGGLGLALQSDSCWTGRYGGGLWLGIAAAAAGAAGILAWRRWYVDNNIRWFFISSTVAATTSLLCLVITAAALAAIQEQKSNQELYRSIYYDQGFVHPQEQPMEVNDFEEIPSLSLQGSRLNESSLQETRGRVEEVTKLPSSVHDAFVVSKDVEPTHKVIVSLDGPNISENTSGVQGPNYHEVQAVTVSKNITEDLSDLSLDDFDISDIKDTLTTQYSATMTETRPEYESDQRPSLTSQSENENNSGILVNDSKSNQGTGEKDGMKDESTHIMRIANFKTSKHTDKHNETLNDDELKLDPNVSSDIEDLFNRPKKSAEEYERNVAKNDGYQKRVVDEDQVSPKVINNDEAQDIMAFPSLKYDPQDTPHIVNNGDYNGTASSFPSPRQRPEQEEEPQYEKLPRGRREVRTVIAINILVASALELAWSLLSASIAWKGMKNCYPHENGTANCERTVEGLESSAPPSSNDTYHSNKRHKTDGVFRKPDIISNHRHCHSGNSIRLNSVQSKNGINRLHVINTVSERINIEPYLPMEESTMEYQERVHRFLASNNVANNTGDSASNIDS